VLGGGEHDVVQPGFSRAGVGPTDDGDAGHHQRFGVDLAVEGNGVELAKRVGIDVGRGELRFVLVDARKQIGIAKGRDIDVGREHPRL
jgi:hypothetical protein